VTALLVALLSDTHTLHDRLALPAVDLLVHAGDMSRRGTEGEILAFLDWYGAQRARARVLVAGNHDFWAEQRPDEMLRRCQERGIHYLQDEGVEVLGLRVWGSPVTPYFRGMAFNRKRGAESKAHWDRIPADLDLLVTHGPPQGILDRTFLGPRVGCEELRQAVLARPPRLHVFGHIHEDAGATRIEGLPTWFHNAARLGMPPSRGVRPAVLLSLP
jgi:Icc-related predicted phosphoesterase